MKRGKGGETGLVIEGEDLIFLVKQSDSLHYVHRMHAETHVYLWKTTADAAEQLYCSLLSKSQTMGSQIKALKVMKVCERRLFTLWQISKELLGICLPSLQRTRLTDRNAGVLYLEGLDLQHQSRDEGRRGQNSVKGDQTWKPFSLTHPSPDAPHESQSRVIPYPRYGMKMICVELLGLSVGSCLADDDGEKVFVTAQRRAVSHHRTQR